MITELHVQSTINSLILLLESPGDLEHSLLVFKECVTGLHLVLEDMSQLVILFSIDHQLYQACHIMASDLLV